eukprot:CAMPEP_0206505642 /NCGR_PEP_ID=MMETSP0324_2-20121206/56263_1 /ASSEMBLY_ACC=CAM_ASM_000836 /TAXON_ID=2866 /ORGANISM="Crypthecodinium cohnii, Strain Seligo" /LENGTH=156 /DNA_ID=CAMNT_0053995163 /DNA_START=269 /DNA_END=735 /DNA_ORIENTATION=+
MTLVILVFASLRAFRGSTEAAVLRGFNLLSAMVVVGSNFLLLIAGHLNTSPIWRECQAVNTPLGQGCGEDAKVCVIGSVAPLLALLSSCLWRDHIVKDLTFSGGPMVEDVVERSELDLPNSFTPSSASLASPSRCNSGSYPPAWASSSISSATASA